MTAQWPGLLWGLLLVPVALAAYLLAQRRRVRYAVRFTNLDLLASVATRSPRWRRHLPPALCLLALAALLVSLTRPEALTLVPREQSTVMLVMDVSGSMNATDVQPTRLVAAQHAATGFVRRLPGKFRVGLVTFASTAQTLTRPTTDRAAVYDTIASLRAEGATAMGDGIERALDVRRPPRPAGAAPTSQTPQAPGSPSRPAGGESPVVVLLLSDGANTQGRTPPLAAAANARQLRVPVFTVALGTDEGMVDLSNQSGQPQHIAVPPDRVTLQKIAEATGARFFAAPTSRDLGNAYRKLGSRIGFIKEKQEVTVLFAAAGLVLVVAAAAISLVWFSRFP